MLRKASPLDRRANVLELTEAGRQLLDDIMPRIQAHEEKIKALLGAQEAPRLLALLERLALLGTDGAEAGGTARAPR